MQQVEQDDLKYQPESESDVGGDLNSEMVDHELLPDDYEGIELDGSIAIYKGLALATNDHEPNQWQ